jgi:hypothetical protein
MTDPGTKNLPAVTENKKRGIRPPSILVNDGDWEAFDAMCFAQATLQEIALFYRVSTRTIERAVRRVHKTTFVAYYSQKRMAGNVSLRRKQIELAIGGNVTMLIWLGKQYLGQADKQTVSGEFHHEHDHEVRYDSLGDDELRKELESVQRELADTQKAIDAALDGHSLEEATGQNSGIDSSRDGTRGAGNDADADGHYTH